MFSILSSLKKVLIVVASFCVNFLKERSSSSEITEMKRNLPFKKLAKVSSPANRFKTVLVSNKRDYFHSSLKVF